MNNEEVKKVTPKEEEPMKIYDKYMYKSQEKIKNIVLIIVVFIIGFITGYAGQYSTINKLEEEVNELQQEQTIE